MGNLEVSKVVAGLAVSDLDAASGWRARLLGRPDALPMDGPAEWHLPPDQTVQLVLDTGRAGGSMVTLQVPDIATTQADLPERGLDLRCQGGASTGATLHPWRST